MICYCSNNHQFRKTIFALISFLLTFVVFSAYAQERTSAAEDYVKVSRVLFIGDSMTGWMAERLNAYGEINGFEVSTIVWDGSTISKWADSPNLKSIISSQDPDAIIVSLGMNEMFEPNPQTKLKKPIKDLIATFGDIPFLWIGPPSWPGHSQGQAFNNWIQEELEPGNYFRSFDLDIPRQSKSNPHPSREGIEIWIDMVAEWIPINSNIKFPSLDKPGTGKMSRGKTFIYKRMKEKL